jgi:hypothetical protein
MPVGKSEEKRFDDRFQEEVEGTLEKALETGYDRRWN